MKPNVLLHVCSCFKTCLVLFQCWGQPCVRPEQWPGPAGAGQSCSDPPRHPKDHVLCLSRLPPLPAITNLHSIPDVKCKCARGLPAEESSFVQVVHPFPRKHPPLPPRSHRRHHTLWIRTWHCAEGSREEGWGRRDKPHTGLRMQNTAFENKPETNSALLCNIKPANCSIVHPYWATSPPPACLLFPASLHSFQPGHIFPFSFLSSVLVYLSALLPSPVPQVSLRSGTLHSFSFSSQWFTGEWRAQAMEKGPVSQLLEAVFQNFFFFFFKLDALCFALCMKKIVLLSTF